MYFSPRVNWQIEQKAEKTEVVDKQHSMERR